MLGIYQSTCKGSVLSPRGYGAIFSGVLYKTLFPSVGLSVGRFVRRSVCPSVGLSVGRSAGQAFVKDGKIDDFEHEINKSSTCALLKSADIAVLPRTG